MTQFETDLLRTSQDSVSLTQGDLCMTLNPAQGGRITGFWYQGRNCLAETSPLTGSTLWPSPQQDWGWPPPAALDSEPYTLSQAGDAWVMTSRPCPQTGLVVSKRVELDAAGFAITYRLFNCRDAAKLCAPWEVSRIYGGYTVFESGSVPLPQSTLPLTVAGERCGYAYSPAGRDHNQKLFINNSRGWLATVWQGLVLKKVFTPVDAATVAPNEAEIEIYAHGDPESPYIEIEQQGEYAVVAPGQFYDWRVLWQLAPLPEGLTPGVDQDDFWEWVRQL